MVEKMEDKDILDEISSVLKVRNENIPKTLMKLKREIKKMEVELHGEKQ